MPKRSQKKSPKSSKQKAQELKAKRRRPSELPAKERPSKPSKTAVIGRTDLFAERTNVVSPKFSEYALVTAYVRTGRRVTGEMRKIGNVLKLWHGTPLQNVYKIAKEGLRVKRSHGAFGGGIYFSPVVQKAMGYARPCNKKSLMDLCALLRCNVAMGNAHEAEVTGDHRDFLKENGYHSLKAFTDPINGIWGGFLQNPEYVVYDHTQVVVTEIFVYRKIYRPSRSFPLLPVNKHPCRKNGIICKNAYSFSGCIVLNKKRGCSSDDLAFCKFYDSGS